MNRVRARTLLLAGALAAAGAGAADEPPDAEFLEFLGGWPADDAAADDWLLVLDGLGDGGDLPPPPPAPDRAPEGEDDGPRL
jgi:hypothetical protein